MEIGPELPAHLTSKQDGSGTTKCDAEETFGPALPPGFKPKPRAIIGPCKTHDDTNFDQLEKEERNTTCDKHEDEDNEIIGPVLPTRNDKEEYLKRQREEIESRAMSKKEELDDKKGKRPKKIEREEWMTELPPELGKNFGLGPRTFRSRDIDLGDRSGWTDTPSDKAKKQKTSEVKNVEEHSKSKKDHETEHYVDEHNKRFRNASLLDMHRKEQKKRKKNEGTSEKERKPFNRETDLGISQMDPTKKKSLIKQSGQLNSKFHHSKEGPAYL